MDYNSQREKLILPEYGRNIQNMIDIAKTITNKEDRQSCAETIIKTMRNVNKKDQDLPDYEEKLWNQLAFLSNYELDIDYPYPIVERRFNEEEIEKLDYPKNHIRFRHYGHNIESLLRKIVEMEASEERDILTALVAQQMAKSLAEWNKDALCEEKIAQDIDYYTKGHVQLDPDLFKLPPNLDRQASNCNKKWRKK